MPGRLSSNPHLHRPVRTDQIQSVIDTGRKKTPLVVKPTSAASFDPVSSNTRNEEREYVLADPSSVVALNRQRKTLAERIGLIQISPTSEENHLTEAAWNDIKQRSNDRQDSNCPCAICQEDFGLDQQVLLSCSHVFHRACLSTFERFVSHNSSGSDQRTCPICRRSQYEKRIIYEGARIHRTKCAARIQAAWRGYIVRQWYKRVRLDMSHIPDDSRLRRKFYQEKLSEITDRIIASCDFDLRDLFNEVDRNMEQSRAIRRAFDARIRTIDDDEWKQIKQRAQQRNEFECSICKCSLLPISNEPAVEKSVKGKKNKLEKLLPQLPPTRVNLKPKTDVQPVLPKRPLVLLSCTHVFHATCLQMFEQYSCDSTHNCPVCRTVYQKNTFSF